MTRTTCTILFAMMLTALISCDDYSENVWSMEDKASDPEAVTDDNWTELGPGVYRNKMTVKVRDGVDDNNLRVLRKAKDVKYVSLSGTQVTDRGLKYLTVLKNLRELSLADTRVTDAGLTQIAQIKSLRILDVHGTRVTQQGVDKLEKQLPLLQVAR